MQSLSALNAIFVHACLSRLSKTVSVSVSVSMSRLVCCCFFLSLLFVVGELVSVFYRSSLRQLLFSFLLLLFEISNVVVAVSGF